eukprot:119529_1
MTNELTKKALLKQSRVLLKKKCKSLKISAEGNKSDMVNRIMKKVHGNNDYPLQRLPVDHEQKKLLLERRIQYKPGKYARKKASNYSIKIWDVSGNTVACDLLINGYINRFIRLNKSFHGVIPIELTHLCFLFIFKGFPAYRIQNGLCSVNEKDKTFTTFGSNSKVKTFAIFDKTQWTNGIHKLKFECICNGKTPISIGMLTNATANSKNEWLFDAVDSHLSYQLFWSGKVARHNGVYCYENGKKELFSPMCNALEVCVQPGAIISMEVNLNVGTIKYYVNQCQIATTMTIKKNQIYYPAIAYCSWDGYCEGTKQFIKYRLLVCA